MSFATERLQVEEALACDTTSAEFPAAATRIREARARLGISENALASKWGVEPSMYWDLELHNSEVFTCVDLAALPGLSKALEIPLMTILFGEEPDIPIPKVSYRDVSGAIARRIAQEMLTVDQLSEKVGWSLQSVVDRPEALGSYNIPGARDICRAVGIDWVGLLQ
jgi:transcriptional regulator with XRE-family HTH domain